LNKKNYQDKSSYDLIFGEVGGRSVNARNPKFSKTPNFGGPLGPGVASDQKVALHKMLQEFNCRGSILCENSKLKKMDGFLPIQAQIFWALPPNSKFCSLDF
jgi:hypothetical protein